MLSGIASSGGKHNLSAAVRQAPCFRAHSRYAGMACPNHPACGRQVDSSAFVPDTALPPRPGGHPSRGGELELPRRLVPDLPAGRHGSTTCIPVGVSINDGGGCGQELVRMARNAFDPRRHSSEGWNPGGRGRGMKEWQGLSDGTFGCRCGGCHSRCAGMACFNHWIPACAGMTEGVKVRNSAGIAKGLSGWRETHSHPRRHSSEGWNPGGRGRGMKEWQGLPDGAFGCRCGGCHSRCAGMDYYNHWIPAFAGMTTGEDSGFHQNDGGHFFSPFAGRPE